MLSDLLRSVIDVHADGEALDSRRRPVADATPTVTGVRAGIVHRGAASTVYDAAGAVLTDVDVLTMDGSGLHVGARLVVTSGPWTGSAVVITEAPVPRVNRRTGATHHWSSAGRVL